MPDLNDVLEAAIRNSVALEKQDNAALDRIMRAYNTSLSRVKDKLNALIIAAGENPTQSQIRKLKEYSEFVETLIKELSDLEAMERIEIEAIVQKSSNTGARDSAILIALSLIGREALPTASKFDKLPKTAVDYLMGYLRPDGPLYERIKARTGANVDRIVEDMIRGMSEGKNPITIAQQLTSDYGWALTDSMRTVRTANLWSYRESTRANYAANGVEKWVWLAELDDKTCLSCAAMHGTIHDMSEPLDDHHNGRCSMLPLSIFGNPVEQSGEDWFRSLPAEQQRAMMGPGKYQAWQEGKFEFSALSTQRPDEVYGQMRTETPLKDLIHD